MTTLELSFYVSLGLSRKFPRILFWPPCQKNMQNLCQSFAHLREVLGLGKCLGGVSEDKPQIVKKTSFFSF